MWKLYSRVSLIFFPGDAIERGKLGIRFSSGDQGLTRTLYSKCLDPGTPSWAVKPNGLEVAVEGKSKTMYCLANGRYVKDIIFLVNDLGAVFRKFSGIFQVSQFPLYLKNREILSHKLHYHFAFCYLENMEKTSYDNKRKAVF